MPRTPGRDPLHNPDWRAQADALRAEAGKLPHGPEKEVLLKKARQLDTAAHLNDWVASPGLKPPES